MAAQTGPATGRRWAREAPVWYFSTLSQVGTVCGSPTTAIAVLPRLEIGATLLLLGARVISGYERLGAGLHHRHPPGAAPPVPHNRHGMESRRNRWLLLGGDGLSAFGAWIDFLAILTLAAYQFRVTPYEMALVSAGGLLPGILAAPLIGRLCDRGSPKRLLLLSIVGRVAATAAILVCRDFTLFVGLVALRSVFASVALPAINVLAVRSIAAPERPRFYAVLNVINNSAKVLAPALGTVSSSLSGEAVALTLSLACSAAAFVVFAGIVRVGERPVAAGVASAATAPPQSLLPLLWIAGTCAFSVFMVNNLVPLVLQRAGFDKSLLGVLVSCSGAGNILSGLWLARRSATQALRGDPAEMLRPALLQTLGFGAIGLLLWLQRGPLVVMLALLFFAIGTASARYAIALNVHLSTRHAAAIGQVSGVLQGWQNTMILLAPLLGAVVLDSFGGPALFAFATGTALLSFALFVAWQARRT